MKELCCIIFAIVLIQWVKKLSRNIEQLINEGKDLSFFVPKNVNEEQCHITKFKYAVCKTCGKKLIYIPTAKGREAYDAEQIVYWEDAGGGNTAVTPNGEKILCNLHGRAENATGAGYLLHRCHNEKGDKYAESTRG